MFTGPQSKASPRRAGLQYIAFAYTVAQKRTSNPIRFTLDADAEVIGCRQVGQGVAAKNRRLCRIDLQPQNNKLTRLRGLREFSFHRHQNRRRSRYCSPYGCARLSFA